MLMTSGSRVASYRHGDGKEICIPTTHEISNIWVRNPN